MYFKRSATRFALLAVLCLFGAQQYPAQNQEAASSPTAQQTVAKIDEYMNSAVRNYHYSGSILVARDGVPIVSKSYGMANYELAVPNTAQSRFRIASITKQFTAMAVMILEERGKLNLDDPICKYLESCPAAWRPITVRHLVTNTSGIPNYRTMPRYAELASNPNFTYTGFVEVFRDAPLLFIPGERFSYSNSGYFLLGLIIERASGQTYAEFLRDCIFTPLSMKNSGYDDTRLLVPNRASGYSWTGRALVNAPYINMVIPFAAGALYSTTEDLLIWDQALYTEKLIPRKSLDEMFTPFRGEYGYGVEISRRFNRRRIRHSGGINGFSNDFARFPEDRVTVIVLGNNGDAPSDTINNSLAAIVFGEPYTMPIPSIRDALWITLEQRGIDAVVKQYRELRRTKPEGYDFREFQLNMMGYDLLAARRVRDAIEIFKLNVEAFPQSANAFDSLAESYMTNGDKKLAIENYEKSLELNPQNTNAANMLKRLREND